MEDNKDELLDWKHNEIIGKGRLVTKDGIFCKCSKRLEDLLSKCDCDLQ